MSITIHPPLETEIRAKAEAEGISVEAYLERLLRADQESGADVERLAAEGLASGTPMDAAADYWERLHRHLDDRLRQSQR
jgi:hypothetical protein